jgi:hemicentin
VLAWKALVLSIALVYYLRLDSRYDRGGGAAPEDLRAAFIAAFDRSVRAPPAMQDVVRQYPLAHVLSEQSRAFYALCVVPPGIAPTRALVENVWAVAVCVQACVGVLLTGPAGCGKTLAMQIVLSNLRGLGSEQEAFTNLKSIRTFAYQCR